MRPAPLRPLLALVLLLPAAALAAPAPAAAPAPPAAQALTPAEAQQLLAVLNDPAKRAQFTATLQAMVKAMPAATHAASPAATPAAPTAKPATKPAAVQVAPNGLGAQILLHVSRFLSDAAAQLVTTVRVVTRYRAILGWADFVATNATERGLIFETAWRLVIILVIALAIERVVELVLRRPHERLAQDAADPNGIAAPDEPEAEATDTALADAEAGAVEAGSATRPTRRRRLRGAWARLRRLPFVLARLVLALLPVAAFVVAGYLLLATGIGEPDNTRLTTLAAIEAYAIGRVLMVVTRTLVSPAHPRLRLLHVSDRTAADIVLWMRRLVAVAVVGATAANVGLLFGLSRGGHDAFIKLVALVDHILLLIVVLRFRGRVASRLRPAPGALGTIALARRWLAQTWHWIAIFYIVALWVVYATEVPNGFLALTHVFLVAVAVLIAGRLVALVALGALDRAFRIDPDLASGDPGFEARASRYYPLLRQTLSAVIVAVTVLAVAQVWGLDVLGWFRDAPLGRRVLSALGTVVVTVVIALGVWEASNAATERRVALLARSDQPVRAARLRTLLPILRTTLLILIVTVVGLTALSEVGINIAPLLAGAGIVGVAIGFGSQKLVQDVITGLFLLLENAMQVGDFVTVSGLSGTVEHLSIRSLRLRATDGSVHLIPFSSVTSVTNTNRGVGNAAVSVTVSAREDTDRVGEVLAEIVAGMRKEDAFRNVIRSDLQLWGVDKVDAVSATLVGQVVCTDSGRWSVQREFNRRMKRRFQELGIEMSPPTQTVRIERGRRAAEAAAGDAPLPPPAAPKIAS